jgi:putative hydrolase of the HAD superfamily
LTGVVFDFGNVIYSVDYEGMARTIAGERSACFLARFVGSPVQIAYETGRATLDEVLRALAREGYPVSRDRFLGAYLEVFAPVPGSRELLASLAEAVPLGLLSNTSPEHARRFIEKTPEFKNFQAAVYSFEVGCMKPDPRTYSEISRRLGVAPRELAYTDDVDSFALAAEAIGMRGIPFRSATDLSRRLVSLGFPLPLHTHA